MDKVGVDGAIVISAFSMYRYDASYAVEVQRAHPGRFAIVKPSTQTCMKCSRCSKSIALESSGKSRLYDQGGRT